MIREIILLSMLTAIFLVSGLTGVLTFLTGFCLTHRLAGGQGSTPSE